MDDLSADVRHHLENVKVMYNSEDVQKLSVDQRLSKFKVYQTTRLLLLDKILTSSSLKVPKPIHVYDNESVVSAFLRFRGTALELCVYRPDFWVLLFFHVIVSVVYFGIYDHSILVSSDVKGIPTARNWPKVKRFFQVNRFSVCLRNFSSVFVSPPLSSRSLFLEFLEL